MEFFRNFILPLIGKAIMRLFVDKVKIGGRMPISMTDQAKNIQVEFTVRVSRWACFYFFVQNLSCWNIYARKNYNEMWERDLGTFSEDEKNALASFKEIRQCYPQEDSPFEKAFFNSERPFEELDKSIPKEQSVIIKRTFNILASKFDLVFIKDSSNLEQWKNYLEEVLNQEKIVTPLIAALITLYSIPPSTRENIDIFLLPSGDMQAGVTEINRNAMGLEVSKLPVKNMIPQVMSVIFFELVHVAFKDVYVLTRTRALCGNDEKRARFVCETVGRLFLPSGVLSLQLLSIPIPPQLSQFMSVKDTKRLLNLASEYIRDSKSIDDKLITEVRDAVLIHTPWQ
jgi:hypothetical protein